MRAFVAIDFDDNLKKRITELQNYFKSHAVSGRWKYVDNFHLTLKFLDEISDTQLTAIDRVLSEICSKNGKFMLDVKNVGYFPGKDAVRVLWLGMGGDLKQLGILQKDIDTGLDKLGFASEKRAYTPHVTIGQEIVFGGSPEEMIGDYETPDLPNIAVDRIFLVKSEQIGRRRVYTPIREYMLKAL